MLPEFIAGTRSQNIEAIRNLWFILGATRRLPTSVSTMQSVTRVVGREAPKSDAAEEQTPILAILLQIRDKKAITREHGDYDGNLQLQVAVQIGKIAILLIELDGADGVKGNGH